MDDLNRKIMREVFLIMEVGSGNWGTENAHHAPPNSESDQVSRPR